MSICSHYSLSAQSLKRMIPTSYSLRLVSGLSYEMALFRTTLLWYGMVWYGMVWYGMVWFSDGSSRMLLIFIKVHFQISWRYLVSYFIQYKTIIHVTLLIILVDYVVGRPQYALLRRNQRSRNSI